MLTIDQKLILSKIQWLVTWYRYRICIIAVNIYNQLLDNVICNCNRILCPWCHLNI